MLLSFNFWASLQKLKEIRFFFLSLSLRWQHRIRLLAMRAQPMIILFGGSIRLLPKAPLLEISVKHVVSQICLGYPFHFWMVFYTQWRTVWTLIFLAGGIPHGDVFRFCILHLACFLFECCNVETFETLFFFQNQNKGGLHEARSRCKYFHKRRKGAMNFVSQR